MAIIGLSKQSTTYEAMQWALDRLGIECIHSQTTETCINSACVDTKSGVSNSTFNSGNSLIPTNVHNSSHTSNHFGKKEALCPSLLILDLRSTKDLDPEIVTRYKLNTSPFIYLIFVVNELKTCALYPILLSIRFSYIAELFGIATKVNMLL